MQEHYISSHIISEFSTPDTPKYLSHLNMLLPGELNDEYHLICILGLWLIVYFSIGNAPKHYISVVLNTNNNHVEILNT